MPNYHINPESGDPLRCSTTPDKCPYGKTYPGQEIYHLQAKNISEARTKAEAYNEKQALSVTAPSISELFTESPEDIHDRIELEQEYFHNGAIITDHDLFHTNDERKLRLLGGSKDGRIIYPLLQNPNLPKDIMDKFVYLGDSSAMQRLADNSNLSKDTQQKIVDKCSILIMGHENDVTGITIYKVLTNLAENKNADPEILDQLANLTETRVPRFVADNPSASQETLAKLAKSEDYWIRQGVLGNPSISVETLKGFINDESEDIRSLVPIHPKVTPEILDKLSDEAFWITRKAVAEHSKTDAKTLAKLAKDSDKDVRKAALKNPNCPMKVLLEEAERKAEKAEKKAKKQAAKKLENKKTKD